MLNTLKCFLRCFLTVFALAWATCAAAAAESHCPALAAAAKAGDAKTLQPAMFKVVNGKSTVYLLGSVHALPRAFRWCTPAIDQAIGEADVFVFEANLDFATAEFHYFMDKRGYLPRGKTLHEMLSPAAQKQFLTLVRDLHIDPGLIDYVQPGVAVLLLQNLFTAVQGGLGPGVDARLTQYGKEHGKQFGYLETLQSQFDLLATLGGGEQVKILEKALAESNKGDKKFQALLAAWTKGDLDQLRSMNEQDADFSVLMLDKRNNAWIPRIETMLNVPKTHLVTVGALHLAGSGSVVDLLCAKGWKVQRVQTGGAATPAGPGVAACRSSSLQARNQVE